MKNNLVLKLFAWGTALACVFVFSACNGDKLDPDLVDSIVGRISVSQVIIDQDDFEMTVGENATLTATVLPDDATDKTLVWSSSKEDVLMVSSAGKAMALSPGKSIITAKAGNKTDFITITVIDNAVRVTGVSLDKTSIALKVGESETLTATVAPADATNKNIIWTSSDEAVATVENGVVTGVSVGGATITVRTEDGNKTAECTVAVRTSLDPSVTTGSDHVSAIGAVLKGKANLDNTIPSDLEVGVLYSTSEGVIASNSTRVKAVNMDANFNYSVTVSPLEPATTYYFRSYVTRNGQDTYGATMSFTTKSLSSMIHTDDASGISAVSAVMNGGFDLTDVPYTEKSFGFRYGTSSSSLTETKVASKNESTGKLWASLPALSPSTRYYYQAYIILNGKEYKESVKSFTTKSLSTMVHTEDASNISAVSAIINANFDMTDVQYSSRTLGFYWGTSSSSLSKKSGTVVDNTLKTMRLNCTTLTPDTRYYYQSYIILDGKEYKENVKSFTTKSLSSLLSTLDATDIAPTSAGINAKLDLKDVQYGSLSYGFYWGTSESSVNTYVKGGDIVEDTYQSSLGSLTHKTQYWYKAYARIDGQSFYGELKSFTTDLVPVESVSLDKPDYLFHTIGGTLDLTATVLPSDATDKSVTWTSSDESVATVERNGKVTAKGNGSATITVTSTDGRKTATCVVTVAQWMTGITLNKTTLSLNEGESLTLVPTIAPNNANDKTLAWESSDESVAKVDQSGKVTAVSKGTATITATANDGSEKSASCSVTVKRLVASIDFDKTTLTLFIGQIETITATVNPSTANNRDLTWSSTTPSVATVDQTGKVTAVAKGTATITATAKDGSGVSKSCQVEVKQQTEGVTLDKTSLTLNEGDTQTLTATITPATSSDKSVTWKSSDESVATVDKSGKVTAVSKGTATITATANDGSGKSASCAVTVKRQVASIDFDKTTLTLFIGQTETITATVNPSTANNRDLTWSSTTPSVATVDQTGKVTAVAKGTATITATAKDGSGVSKSCQVEVKQQTEGVTLDKTSLTLNEGDTQTLTATITPATSSDKSVTWKSSDESVATIDQTGKVTAVAKGTATITATANDGSGKSASCAVTVKRLVASISFDKMTISLYPGQTASITATVSPSTANERGLTWESSNTSVATVSSSGVVTGVAKGSAIITATAKDGSGVSKSCQVEVTQYVTGITLSKTTLSLNEGEYALLTETVSPSTAYDKSVTWSSSDRAIATVDQSGKVTAVSKGTAMITATANDGSGKTASCEVTVIRLVSSITLDKTSITIYNGTTQTLTATVSPSTVSNTGVTWSSSNTSVATVSSSGVVTGVARGTATITVTAKDGSGKSASCQVEVKQYVTGITLNKTSLSLNEGLTSPLSVSSITPDNANDKTYTWSSSNTSVATVSTTGVVTAVSKGTATITATANDGSGKSVSCSVTVIRLVSSITLDKASISIYNGKTQTLTATVSPSTANNIGVTWTSSNTSVATVSSSGVVTGIGRGTATITVTAKDGSGKSASCQVEVKQYVTGITLNKTSLSLNEGLTSPLSVSSITPDNANDKTYTWSSSNTSVATVSTAGVVTAVSKGTVTITATANDGSGKSASCEVTVIRLVSSITLDKTITIYNGKTQTLTATISPSTASNTGVTWTSSNTSVATVSSSGEVTGVSRGTATITATAQDGSGKSASCEVEVKQYVTGITLNTTDIFLYEGQTSTLSVSSITPDNANDKTYTWSSSRTSVATVSASGVVTAVSKGMTEITATANDGSGKTASCEVWVLRPVSSITLDKTSITIYNGTTQTLTATVSPSTASNTGVTWTSSNTSVATVSTSGVVTGVARGTATITATAKDGSGKTASCEVKVGQNLSVSNSANCYIVSVPGDYCFRTTKGNSSTSVGIVTSAEVLWESYGTSTTPSVGSVINSVSYSSNTIAFSTPSTLNNGNAVVAAKDANGNILWSWHIWVCGGYSPESTAQTYYNNAGTMMDRNLGATSASPGDVQAYGLRYQWGRKDPFLGYYELANHSKSNEAVSTLSWPTSVTSDSNYGTIEYAVANPTVRITSNSNGDWYYTGSSTTNNTRWQSSKTIYDPCPPGWRVPDGGSNGVWSKAVGGSNAFSCTVDSTNEGVNFSGKFGSAETIWYPATGSGLNVIRDFITGKMKEIVTFMYGDWWSCTPDGLNAYCLVLGYGPRVNPLSSSTRASAYPVRCIQE